MVAWYDNAPLDTVNTVTDIVNTHTIFERVLIDPPILAARLRFRTATVAVGANYRLGLYSEAAAAPSALLAQTAAFAVADNTTYEVNLLTAVAIGAATHVWVARQFSLGAGAVYEAIGADQNYVNTVSGGYAAGFPAVAGAVPLASDEAWSGVYDGTRPVGIPQGCYYIEYSTDSVVWTDISGGANSIRTPRRSRRFSETQPQATDTPIIAMSKRAAERVTIQVMYTQKDGDVFNVLRQRFENNELLMLRWSPAGGNAGDYNFVTDTVYSYIVDMEVPGGDARRSADPLIATFTVITQDVTQGSF